MFRKNGADLDTLNIAVFFILLIFISIIKALIVVGSLISILEVKGLCEGFYHFLLCDDLHMCGQDIPESIEMQGNSTQASPFSPYINYSVSSDNNISNDDNNNDNNSGNNNNTNNRGRAYTDADRYTAVRREYVIDSNYVALEQEMEANSDALREIGSQLQMGFTEYQEEFAENIKQEENLREMRGKFIRYFDRQQRVLSGMDEEWLQQARARAITDQSPLNLYNDSDSETSSNRLDVDSNKDETSEMDLDEKTLKGNSDKSSDNDTTK